MAFIVGERVVAESKPTGRRPRSGVIEEVLRGDPSPRYRIRWDDGHESIYTPAGVALRAEQRRKMPQQAASLKRRGETPDALPAEQRRERTQQAASLKQRGETPDEVVLRLAEATVGLIGPESSPADIRRLIRMGLEHEDFEITGRLIASLWRHPPFVLHCKVWLIGGLHFGKVALSDPLPAELVLFYDRLILLKRKGTTTLVNVPYAIYPLATCATTFWKQKLGGFGMTISQGSHARHIYFTPTPSTERFDPGSTRAALVGLASSVAAIAIGPAAELIDKGFELSEVASPSKSRQAKLNSLLFAAFIEGVRNGAPYPFDKELLDRLMPADSRYKGGFFGHEQSTGHVSSRPVTENAVQLLRVANLGDSRASHWESYHAVAFSPDGRRFGTANSYGLAAVWEVPSGRSLVQIRHKNPVVDIAFSPDGYWVATASHDRASVWELPSAREIAQIRCEGKLSAVAFSPDGRWLATVGHTNAACVWELPSARQLAHIKDDDDKSLLAVAFGPDGRWLATASSDGTVRVWELSSGRQLMQIKHESSVKGIAFSPDGRCLATASSDNMARVSEVPSGRERVRVKHRKLGVESVAFSPDGRCLATASSDHTARVWELSGGRQRAQIIHKNIVYALAFSPDGRWLATGTFGNAAVWELEF